MNKDNDIQIVTVKNSQQINEFIKLPHILHKDHPKWVPPIYAEERKYYNPNKNLAHAYCDVELAICYKDKKPVGRIMGIVNHRYNEAAKEKTARFSNFESIDDDMVASALLNHIEEWAVNKGIKSVTGPFGMNYHDPIGFMIDGFEHEPSISTYYNFSYITTLIENSGYSKKYDLVAYNIDMSMEIPELHKRIFERLSKRSGARIMKLNSKKDLKLMIAPILKLLNETYVGIDGYSALDENEMIVLAKQYLPLLDHRYVKIAHINNSVVGFLLAMPNISSGIRACGGKLYPFGFLRILNSMKKSKQLDLLLGGISDQYKGKGIDALLAISIINSAKQYGFDFVDSHLEVEYNYKVRGEMEKLGGKVYKRYRLYQKELQHKHIIDD